MIMTSNLKKMTDYNTVDIGDSIKVSLINRKLSYPEHLFSPNVI